MNGQMKNYKKYLDSLKTMEEPMVPDVIFDMQGLVEYAGQKGVRVSQLSDEEKQRFVQPKKEAQFA